MSCPNINHNLSWKVDGSVNPCNNLINFPKFYSVSELKSSDEYKLLVSDHNNNIKSKFCQRCWDKQKVGLESKYLHDTKLDKIYKKINPKYIKIDGALGGVCNAACVICGPDSSSLWQKFKPIGKIENNSEIWKICNTNAENILQLDFGGGEPWLNHIEKQISLFDKFIQMGTNKNIKLRYNTNGSLYPKKLLDKLKYFRQVEITLSIDDIEERFEYNRWPLKWSEVLNNLENLKVLSDNNKNIILTINYTVSVFTWLRAEVFNNWAKDFGIDKVNFNILADPLLYSIKSVPSDKITTKTSFDEIVGSEVIPDWNSKFLKQLDHLDKQRNTEWHKIFPELKEII